MTEKQNASKTFDDLVDQYLMHSDDLDEEKTMTAVQAYEKVCDFVNGKPGVAICRDYEGYFGFFFYRPALRKAIACSLVVR